MQHWSWRFALPVALFVGCPVDAVVAQPTLADPVVRRVVGVYDESELVFDVHFHAPPGFDRDWDFQLFIDSDNLASTGHAHGFDVVVRGVGPLRKALPVHETMGGSGPAGWGDQVGGGSAHMVTPQYLRITLAYDDSGVAHGAVRYTFEAYVNGALVSSIRDLHTAPAGDYVVHDCNGNGIPDDRDIAGEISDDCSGNGIPDECEPDCDSDGLADVCAILVDPSLDCDGDGVPNDCEAFARAGGPRYIAIKPSKDSGNVALLVRGDDDDAAVRCVNLYVQADGTLATTAHFASPSQWCKVYVTDDRILAGHFYRVFEDRGTVGRPALSKGVSVTLWRRGDSNDDQAVDFTDIARAVDGFLGHFTHDLSRWMVDQVADTASACQPDGMVTFNDVAETVDAFLEVQNPNVCPPPCP